MTRYLKTALTLTVMGLLLSMAPGSRFCDAQDDHPAQPHPLEGITIQVSVTVVHIEAEAIDQLQGSAESPSLATLPLDRLWEMARSDEGVHIVSRSSLSVLNGHEARMSFSETEHHKTENEEESGEFSAREVVVNFEVKPQVDRQQNIAVKFNYKRTESEEVHFVNEDNEEEEGMEQQFEMSNTLVLTPGQARISGAKQTEDIAMLLVMTADLDDRK